MYNINKKPYIEIRLATKTNNETNYKEMEKQIQTLTSELNHLKNNQNKVANSETEYHSQQQNQATPSPPSMPSPRELQIL